jgi:hypothetical protein
VILVHGHSRLAAAVGFSRSSAPVKDLSLYEPSPGIQVPGMQNKVGELWNLCKDDGLLWTGALGCIIACPVPWGSNATFWPPLDVSLLSGYSKSIHLSMYPRFTQTRAIPTIWAPGMLQPL